ncbi:MAG: caspase family protein, partial [Pirellulaceae bacterium]|nr:caspase family protein [Pirellulaceae bacterium]
MITINHPNHLRKSLPGSAIVSRARRENMRLLLFAGLLAFSTIIGLVIGSSLTLAFSRGAEPNETPPAKAIDEQHLAEDPAPSTGRLYVLLIGCGHYPNLPRDYQLQGPPNDVAITRELIQSERFGVKPEDVMVLVSGSVPEREPTGANIRAAFEKMCSTVQPNDQVLILLAGHGCQVPNNNPEEDHEPDGLDEAFVPADVSAWDAKNPPRPNELILDDEIGAWTDRMSQAGARVFLVADCCHAGSINRGPGEPLNWVRERRLPPIFSPVLDDRLESSPDPSKDEQEWEVPAGVVSLFAVPARFAELEDRMPPHSNGGVATVHGRLTFALNQVLRNARRSLTYRELIQQLVWQYQAWSWNPRPYINGADLDREVLGVREWPTRSWITATKELKRFRLNVGFLDQIAPGSIFELFPADRAEGSDVRLGFLKVSRVEAGECLAEPCAYENHTAVHVDELPLGANAELVYRELGDARLPVGLMAAANETPNQELWTACEAALVNMFKDPRRLVRPPESDETPQLFVVVGANQAWIQHGTG